MIGSRRDPARRRGERGAAMVEFALIAPIFIALVFGIISYGWMLSYRQGMSQAAAEAARVIAVAPSGTSDAELVTRARSAVDDALGSYGVSCEGSALMHGTTNVGSCAITPRAACSSGSGSCTSVAITHNYRDEPLLPSFPGLGITLPNQLKYSSSMEVG